MRYCVNGGPFRTFGRRRKNPAKVTAPFASVLRRPADGDDNAFKAEGVGFEPTVPLRARWFSRPVHSTALPPLRRAPGNPVGLTRSRLDGSCWQQRSSVSTNAPDQALSAGTSTKYTVAGKQRRSSALKEKADPGESASLIWRRGRDSNPRYGGDPYAGLANRWFQPLTHLSEWLDWLPAGNPTNILPGQVLRRMRRVVRLSFQEPLHHL